MLSRANEFAGWETFPLGKVPVIKGSDVIEARRRVKATQREFAQHMGTSVRTVMRWERDPDCRLRDPCQAREINAILRWG